jgi:murein DD-endopeptidase MepM/ murein hydrolase activator NlpD
MLFKTIALIFAVCMVPIYSQELVYPFLKPASITSPFGDRPNPLLSGYGFHTGVDLGVKLGTGVFAIADGIVVSCYPPPKGKFKGDAVFGGLIVLKVVYHDLNLYVMYAHLKEVFVRENQKIIAGYLLGLSGSTGESTGPHLHFEILINPTEAPFYYRTDLNVQPKVQVDWAYKP